MFQLPWAQLRTVYFALSKWTHYYYYYYYHYSLRWSTELGVFDTKRYVLEMFQIEKTGQVVHTHVNLSPSSIIWFLGIIIWWFIANPQNRLIASDDLVRFKAKRPVAVDNEFFKAPQMAPPPQSVEAPSGERLRGKAGMVFVAGKTALKWS